MAYTLDPGADVLGGMRSIARDQIDAAISDLVEPGDDVVAALHDCRKRCKKVRGLLRLVRPALGDQYSPANATFRDAARKLSPLRDAHALLRTFDDLVAARRELLGDHTVDGVRRGLVLRSQHATSRASQDSEEVAAALELLRLGEAMIDDWTLTEKGFDAVAGGLRTTYERGHDALAEAIDAPTPENFHEYRKRTKYTWYHVRLLDEVAPSITDPLQEQLHALSDTLGDDHDLAVMADQLRDEPDEFGGDDEVATALLVVDGSRVDLQRRAIAAGTRLHAEKPSAFVERLAAYWDAWQRFGPEVATGDIADLAGAPA